MEIEHEGHTYIIPTVLWQRGTVFNKQILPSERPLLQAALKIEKNSPWITKAVQSSRSFVVWVLLALRVPKLSNLELQKAADYLLISSSDLIVLAATLGNLSLVQNCLLKVDKSKIELILSGDANKDNKLKAYNFAAYRWAAENGQLEIMCYLETKAPHKLNEMVKAVSFYAYAMAAQNKHLLVMQHLEALKPEYVQQMLQANKYQAYRLAVEYCHLDVLDHLETINKAGIPEMIQADNYRVYRLAAENGRLDLMQRFEKLVPALKNNMIRANNSEAFRMAVANGYTDIAVHCEIPVVQTQTDKAKIISNQPKDELGLRNLAKDKESSIGTLSIHEQKRLEEAIKRYKPIIDISTESVLMSELRQQLIDRYKLNPARIIVNGRRVELPMFWKDFNELKLRAEDKVVALTAYYTNKNHTAWRFLLKPNPWLAKNASFVYPRGPNPSGKWSCYERYRCMIILYWLAAKDSTVAPTDGHTLEGRLEHYFDELAIIGRSHNWDKKRRRPNGLWEQYDDLMGDKPSCFSGVKLRLFQSVIGHPLFKALTQNDIKMELRDFVREHFKSRISSCNITLLINELDDYYIQADFQAINELKKFDIDTVQQKQFIETMATKYGKQFLEDPWFIKYLKQEFTLTECNGVPMDAHALKFDGLVSLKELLDKFVTHEDKVVIREDKAMIQEEIALIQEETRMSPPSQAISEAGAKSVYPGFFANQNKPPKLVQPEVPPLSYLDYGRIIFNTLFSVLTYSPQSVFVTSRERHCTNENSPNPK